MPTIKARVGSQNVVRVLSQQTSAVSKLLNLSDVESTRQDTDGVILVCKNAIFTTKSYSGTNIN